MAVWYCGSTKWSAVTAWAASTAYSVGDLRRQLATPAVGSERVFRCTTAGTSGGTEPTWNTTAGATTNDGTAVWTEVTGQSAYGWGAAAARLSHILASGWAAAGDTVYVSNNHAATRSTNNTLTTQGTAANPVNVLCVDDASAPPTAMATTASETNTSTTNLTFGNSHDVFYGITFNCGTGAGTTDLIIGGSGQNYHHKFINCALKILGTATSSILRTGNADSIPGNSLAEFIDTSITFSNASQRFQPMSRVLWRGGSLAGTAPTTLFIPLSASGPPSQVEVRGVDLSLSGSGKNLVDISRSSFSDFAFIDCKLGASVSITTGSVASPGGTSVRLVNCDSADTNYRYHRQSYQGTITQETTIVRSGGASDGTTSVSRKMVTTANSKFYAPLESDPIVYWNETLSSQTATIEVVTDGVTLTDAEAWLEVEYLGTSGFPVSSVASDRSADILASSSNQTTSSVTWTTTGLSSPTKQKLSVTFTPAEKGPVRLRVMLAKASTTMYFCPKADIT